MAKTMKITEVRDALMKIPDMLSKESAINAIEVTRWGKRVLAIVPWDEYECIAETREILLDKKALKGIKRGTEASAEGKSRDASDVRKKLGL